MSDIKQLISIIVPVFNESESIGFLLDEVINVMSFHKFNFELIVVNDGSKDNTHQVLKQLTLKIKELSVISLRKIMGKLQQFQLALIILKVISSLLWMVIYRMIQMIFLH